MGKSNNQNIHITDINMTIHKSYEVPVNPILGPEETQTRQLALKGTAYPDGKMSITGPDGQPPSLNSVEYRDIKAVNLAIAELSEYMDQIEWPDHQR